MKYYILKYVDSFPETWKAGEARGPLIRILERKKDDLGVLEHEKCHVRQWWFTLGFHPLLYRFSKRYKFWAEVKAFKQQMKYHPNPWWYAQVLAERYDLGITRDEAYQRLIDE